MQLTFHKYQGTGNDFILFDNRSGNISLSTQQVKSLCNRRFGIGGDGLMLLNTKEGYDFEMLYYNADGHEGSMCGNGGRCMTRFAHDLGLHLPQYRFLAADGEHLAETEAHGWIRLKMKDVTSITQHHGDAILHTGSPHYIKPVADVMGTNVLELGKEIRYSKEFAAEGINVNFVESADKRIIVRTYERGVEDETFSCGTGVTAAALVFAHNENGFNRMEVQTLGGHLAVEFTKTGEQTFEQIWLCGPATFVYQGIISL